MRCLLAGGAGYSGETPPAAPPDALPDPLCLPGIRRERAKFVRESVPGETLRPAATPDALPEPAVFAGNPPGTGKIRPGICPGEPLRPLRRRTRCPNPPCLPGEIRRERAKFVREAAWRKPSAHPNPHPRKERSPPCPFPINNANRQPRSHCASSAQQAPWLCAHRFCSHLQPWAFSTSGRPPC